MDTASRPDVPDTVWAIDTVQAVEGLTRAASDPMEGSTQLQAGSTGDTVCGPFSHQFIQMLDAC